MHIRLLIITIAIALAFLAIRDIRRQPKAQKNKQIFIYGFSLLMIILLGLVFTGKVHWITAGIAALIPFVIKLSALAIRLLPTIQFWKSAKSFTEQARAKSQGESKASSSGFTDKMTVQQAKEIFGLDELVDAGRITKRHRELMQKIHPDRGGSDYLAAQINLARDILIEHIKK
ncbi:MAG: small-conductance mechanosensitive channel [Cellvibrionaceae bacterium]|jgi:small-conductance mechanosensitive channel